MAFVQIAASSAQRCRELLSADNMARDRFTVIDLIRRAAPLLGMKAPVIATLDALLSCLPPKRNHHIVFASNDTLSFRRDGLTDRSLRRHFAQLEELGFLVRHDSPNRKRFSRYNPETQMAMRFGFDLNPLFTRLPEVAAIAAHAGQVAAQIHYLRLKLFSMIAGLSDLDLVQAMKTKLRRKLSADQLQDMVTALQDDAPAPLEEAVLAENMSDADGQNVRHLHKTKKEEIELNANELEQAPQELDLNLLLSQCPEPQDYAMKPVKSVAEVISHARFIAPMIGISLGSYNAAQKHIGEVATAVTVWLLVQKHRKINKMAAYFQSLTLGRHSADYNAFATLTRYRPDTIVRGQI